MTIITDEDLEEIYNAAIDGEGKTAFDGLRAVAARASEINKADVNITLLRAGSVGDIAPPTLNISVKDEFPDDIDLTSLSGVYKDQGLILADALLSSLPGGTIDAILCEMLSRRASLLRVPFNLSKDKESDIHVVVTERDDYEQRHDSHPLVLEQLADKASLNDIKEIQQKIGDRLGKTRIARLVFIDE